MRLFDRITGGRVFGSGFFPPREAHATARSSVPLSPEIADAIDSAHVSMREADDDGPRVMVISHVFRGAFIYSREEASRRLRLAYPSLPDDQVARATRHLESRVRLVVRPAKVLRRQTGWVHGWRE